MYRYVFSWNNNNKFLNIFNSFFVCGLNQSNGHHSFADSAGEYQQNIDAAAKLRMNLRDDTNTCHDMIKIIVGFILVNPFSVHLIL